MASFGEKRLLAGRKQLESGVKSGLAPYGSGARVVNKPMEGEGLGGGGVDRGERQGGGRGATWETVED